MLEEDGSRDFIPERWSPVAPQLERNFADGSTPACLSFLPRAFSPSHPSRLRHPVTSTLSISLKADANEHMEVTWKYDVKNVGGGEGGVFIPAPRKSHDGHMDLTGERDGDIYLASQLAARAITTAWKKTEIIVASFVMLCDENEEQN